jgi:TRAP-type uncharacterized transport system substrate-binding protein
MNMQSNFRDSSRPLHKGAARFWAEMGVAVPDKLKPID